MMITVSSIDLIKKLKKADSDIKNFQRSGALHDYLYDVWQVGHDQVKADYGNALTLEGEPANESTTIVSTPKWASDGFELIASGQDILFLEFGTGVNQDFTHPWGAEFGYTPASYSVQHYGFLVDPKLRHFHGQWPHEKRLHWGQNPARGMYNASKAMQYYLRVTPLKVF